MAYLGTITTENEIAAMAGENVDATGDTEANHNVLVFQAESYLSMMTGLDVVDGFAGFDANTKQILSEYAARYVAMSLIAYNMAGFTGRQEAEDMINIHVYRIEKIERILMRSRKITLLGSLA